MDRRKLLLSEFVVFFLIIMLLILPMTNAQITSSYVSPTGSTEASIWSPVASEWTISTVDSSSYDPSLELDKNEMPHISYKDQTKADLKYAFWDGSSWVTQTVDSTYNAGYNPSLELDNNSQPHISYGVRGSLSYNSNGQYMEVDSLNYAVREGNSWKITAVGDVFSSVMKLDSNDQPHISYSSGGSLWYVYWNGSSWIKMNVDSAGHYGPYLSLALDSCNQPSIAYYKYKNTENFSNGALMYAWFSGAGWEIMTVDSEVDGNDINLVLDHSGQPHISYSNKYAPYSLKYAVLEDGLWRITAVDPSIPVGVFSSLALDSEDQPHIVYCDITNNTNYDATSSILKYAWFSGTDWKTMTIESNLGDFSLVLDKNDRPHISYVDLQNHDLKYAVLASSPSPTPTVPEFSWLAILPLFLSLLFCVVLVRFKDRINKNTK